MRTGLPGECKRLAALREYGILDTPGQALYDSFVSIAAQVCGVRMAALSFIDADREWFKACYGAELTQLPRSAGFAEAIVDAGDLVQIGDAAEDERFANSLLVTGRTQVRFYAGVPLRSHDGEVLGALSVMSRIPRVLSEPQQHALRELAVTIMAALEAHREVLELFSKSKQAQEQVALLLSAIDVAGDVILVYRVDERSQLALAYMNQTYTRQTGYTRDEALGRPLSDFRHAMPDDQGMRDLREAIRSGEPAQLEIVSYRKDGSSFWNQVTMHPVRDEAGTITHWISVERDVSEAVERESKLEDEHARLLQLTAAARRIFSALDARVLLGRVEEAVRELLGGTVTIHRVPDPPAQFEEPLLARASQTRDHVTDEGRYRAAVHVGGASAAYVLELVAGSGRTLRSGDLFMLDLLAEYFGVALRNALLVDELEERRSAILELNEVKTDLIAMLAHDFKSPLTSIVGFTELAMELGPVNDDQREYLDSVKKIALRLADLASDTLAFSRLERNEIDLSLDDVDLAETTKDVASSLADQRAIHVSCSGRTSVRGDAHRLRQIIYNLVENAIKYSPEAQPVEIKVRGTDERVRIAVTDRGIGIPRKEVPRIFGRFSRASNARKLRIAGTGFGLYLARQIVELHGGTITVTSAEHKGSTFTVELPVAPVSRSERPLNVVVLEAEREQRSFIVHALREGGLRVRIAHSPAEFLNMIEDEPADRLVIDLDEVAVAPLDVAAIEVQQARSGFEVIAIGEGEHRFARARRLAKPFLVQDLLRAIRSRPV